MMRMLVVGATGYIGRPLLEQAGAAARGTSTSGGQGLLPLDLEKPLAFDYAEIGKGDVVFVLAAISSPDACARQKGWAHSINVTGTIAFIESVMARGGKVIFFSSDAVYGERPYPFDEREEPRPLGDYADMKRAVERRFSSATGFRAIRLSYVFSRTDSFTRYLFNCAAKGVTAEVFPSLARSVVSREDVISAALSLARTWDEVPEPVINFGGPGILSRAEFAAVLRAAALPNLRFIEKDPDESFFCSRPRRIAMLSPVMSRLLRRKPTSLEVAALSFAL
jgi:nucleoside-diphosphate-sugar epimerase